jgi:hypothetical protein
MDTKIKLPSYQLGKLGVIGYILTPFRKPYIFPMKPIADLRDHFENTLRASKYQTPT